MTRGVSRRRRVADAAQAGPGSPAAAPPLLLAGSATPRPETWAALPRLTLPERVAGRPLPPVDVLDMRGAGHPLHPVTRRALSEARKAILLLNRRGWSNFLTCRTCGKVWECPQCDVALVLHRADNVLACHHCGHRERVPERCDACGSPSVARYGAGTERLEAELAEALDVPVFRLDADTSAGKDAVPELLARFAAAPAGLLIGTQMVAKGHDFPDVTLGVVVDADSTLRFPDFRAEERTFALIAQLAGRAGRGPRGGRVLVQTTSPDAAAIVAAARHDTPGFVAGELERRRALDYPPFADLIRVVCTAEEPAPARAAAGAIAEPAAAARGAAVLGPAPCSGSAAGTAGRSSSRPMTGPRRSPRCATRWTARPTRRPTAPSRSPSTSTRSERAPAGARGGIDLPAGWPTNACRTNESPPTAWIRRRAPAARRRSSSCASTGILSCAAARSRSTASTPRCSRRSGGWAG